jgi:anti-sigma factor RsiW
MDIPEDIATQLMAYLDGEMNEEQARAFRAVLDAHPEWAEEARTLGGVVDSTSALSFRAVPAGAWDGYWEEIDARLARRTGWMFLALGGGVLGLMGFLKVLVWSNNLWVRAGLVAVVVGLAILVVSVVRGRLLELPHDRYSRIRR